MSKVSTSRRPSFSLQRALSYALDLYDNNGRNPIRREAAAQILGSKGLTGKATRVLATLGYYDLIVKSGAHAVAVSPLALSLLTTTADSAQRKTGLNRAAYSPEIFRVLHERFVDDSNLSVQAIKGYLAADAAFLPDIAEGIAAIYLANRDFLHSEEASDSDIAGVSEKAESVSEGDSLEEPMNGQNKQDGWHQDYWTGEDAFYIRYQGEPSIARYELIRDFANFKADQLRKRSASLER